MSVRQSLLAILAQGPCYGYQLRSEFERRTGSSTSLNVGQINRSLGTRDELAIKLALAATLPGVDVIDLIRAQRRTSMAHLESLRRATFRGDAGGGPEELAWALVTESTIFAAEAEVRWLDQAEDQLMAHPARTMALEIETRRPKRGRPASPRSAPIAP